MIDTVYYIVLVGTFVFFFLTFFIVYAAVFQNKKKVVFGQELLRAKMEIKEQTLRQIAFELHDNLGQIASLIKINLTTLEWNNQPKAVEKIEDTKNLVRQLIADLKSLSISLNSDRISQLGLVKALELEVETINKTGQFQAMLTVERFARRLEPNLTTILYRIAQEILNNAVKHSQCKQISVSISENGNLITFVFHDDGVGFNVNEANEAGSGLGNLQSRAKLINGRLSVQSSPGNGTTIVVEVPSKT